MSKFALNNLRLTFKNNHCLVNNIPWYHLKNGDKLVNLCYNRIVMIWIRGTCQENAMISIHDVSPSLEKKISFLSTKSLLHFMDKFDPTLEMVTASVLCMYTFIISTRVHRITFFLNRNIVNLVNDYFLLIILLFIRLFLSNV